MSARMVGAAYPVLLLVADDYLQSALLPKNLQPSSWMRIGCAVNGPTASFGSPV